VSSTRSDPPTPTSTSTPGRTSSSGPPLLFAADPIRSASPRFASPAMIQQPSGPLTGLAPANHKLLADCVQMSSSAASHGRTYILFLSSFVKGEDRMWCPVSLRLCRCCSPLGHTIWALARTDESCEG
jgi:hypothetical protein